MNEGIPTQTRTNTHIISPFGISEETFQLLETLQKYIESLVNTSDTVQPNEHEIPPCLQEYVITTATGILEMQNQRSPWYDVQCKTCEQAADALGVETETIRNWIRSGMLPASRIGKAWFIRLKDVDVLLRRKATLVPMVDRRYNKNFKYKFS